MKKRNVISLAQLPTAPLRTFGTVALWWLFWDRIGIPGWAWGVFWTCAVIYAVLIAVAFFTEEQTDLDLLFLVELIKRKP